MGKGTKARFSPAALGMAAALAGCGSGDVWVGQVQEGLDLAQCAGTTCSGVDPRELEMPEPRSCDEPLGAELIEDFSVEIPDTICPDARYCQYSVTDLDIAPDGSSWVVGHLEGFTSGPSELWATHFGSQGELLANRKVATGLSFNGGSVGQSADLAVDARGHAFILVYQIDYGPNADAELVEQSWLTELDTEGEEVHGPLALAGIAAGHLAVRDDGSVVLAATALRYEPYSVVAALNGAGERLWSRADLSTISQTPDGAIAGLNASSSGAALVFAKRQRNGDDYRYGLTRFDEAGDLTWDVVFDRRMYYAMLASGGDGDALISHGSWLGYVRDDGTAGWSYELSSSATSAAIDVGRERAYALGSELLDSVPSTDEPQAITELFAIALDGESCERHALPEGAPTGHLRIDGQGRFYVIGEAAASDRKHFWPYVLTRLRLPEE